MDDETELPQPRVQYEDLFREPDWPPDDETPLPSDGGR